MKKKKINNYAKTSFIFAMFFFVPAINIFTSALAIAFGKAALNDIKENKQRGRTLAIASITIGIVTLILTAIAFLTYNLWLK